MFVVTNRQVNENCTGLDVFGKKPNPEGPNELRLVEATKTNGRWGIKLLPDELDDSMMKKATLVPETGTDGNPLPVYASQYAARKVFERVNPRQAGQGKGKGRNLVFFVHGFNNDIGAVLNRAEGFAKNYGTEVIAFSWPANGGGVRGAASYLSDKRDARASVGALDRCLAKVYDYLNAFNRLYIEQIPKKAQEKFSDDAERRDQFITSEMEKGCPFNVSLVLHSMGNYLYKQVLDSPIYHGRQLLFDNVVMVAADTNNKGHAEWVDRIQCRGRIYITINENDSALRVSRAKLGQEQLARLGHYPHSLDSQQAIYVDFTDAPHVHSAHAYFEDDPMSKNAKVKAFFNNAFNGRRAEDDLLFDPATRMHKFRPG